MYLPEAVRYMQRKCFGPTRVFDANGISIASAVLQGSLGDRPTDRPCYSVGYNRWSAQWRSQILLLSTATTSIYGAVDSTDRINLTISSYIQL